MINVIHARKRFLDGSTEGIINAQEDKKTPRLEALVRESVQNSLDAAKPGSSSVQMDFVVGQLDIPAISTIFPELSQVFNDNPSNFISIRDSGTVGLNGDVRDENANYRGLLTEFSRSGKNSSSQGGMWGKGKSVFYRQGSGFVIFYSRVHTPSGFESRMNAIFVNHRGYEIDVGITRWSGFSMWGGDFLDEDEIGPIYDESTIVSILDCFNLLPFGNEETGTLIIMPSVDLQSLLMDVRETSKLDPNKPWLASVPKCIDFFVQKWFSPRLDNDVSSKPRLTCTVDSSKVSLDYNLFRLFRNLYNDSFDVSNKNVLPIPKGNQNNFYGWLAWGIYSYDDFKDGIFFNDPYVLCNVENNSKDGNRPIVTYTRSPGMFLNFNDPEFERIQEINSDRYLLAVFRLNPDADTLVSMKDGSEMSLEKYVRSTELSNHGGWEDTMATSINPVKNIKRQIREKLQSQLRSPDNDRVAGLRSTEGRFVAERLFPEGGSYVSTKRSGGGDGPKPPRPGPKRPRAGVFFEPSSSSQTTDGVIHTGKMIFRNSKMATLSLGASAGSTILYSDQWREKIGTAFPIKFRSLTILSFTEEDGTKKPCEITLSRSGSSNGERFSLSWVSESQINISSGRFNTEVEISIVVDRPISEMVLPVLTVSYKGVVV
ncbi:hypothetical protein AUP07_0399 [methanogenic archaeon mixed culture ISO4-G1]|nr:hypothetical protein AUP07_0399 [methanogenic archaeon mixed culture ISO4-G1]